MESMRDVNRVMEREIKRGSSPLQLDHIEFGDYSYQEIMSQEKLFEVLTYLLRIGDFKQYVGKTILNNVYMDLRWKKPVFKRTKTIMERNNIFAKLSPIQKARIVRVLKQNGNVVGYMGDGINDSPALTNSDVGISVDTAVDIAKETADIILLEKDLNVLLDGVMERKKNICKFNEIYKNGNKLQLWGSSFSNYCKHCTTIFT